MPLRRGSLFINVKLFIFCSLHTYWLGCIECSLCSLVALLCLVRVELGGVGGCGISSTNHHGLVELHILELLHVLLDALWCLFNGLMRRLDHRHRATWELIDYGLVIYIVWRGYLRRIDGHRHGHLFIAIDMLEKTRKLLGRSHIYMLLLLLRLWLELGDLERLFCWALRLDSMYIVTCHFRILGRFLNWRWLFLDIHFGNRLFNWLGCIEFFFDSGWLATLVDFHGLKLTPTKYKFILKQRWTVLIGRYYTHTRFSCMGWVATGFW